MEARSALGNTRKRSLGRLLRNINSQSMTVIERDIHTSDTLLLKLPSTSPKMASNTRQPEGTTESASRTMTISPTPDNNESGPSRSDHGRESSIGVLKLRGGPVRRQRVMWSDETIDNEGMGKKKSKSESSPLPFVSST